LWSVRRRIGKKSLKRENLLLGEKREDFSPGRKKDLPDEYEGAIGGVVSSRTMRNALKLTKKTGARTRMDGEDLRYREGRDARSKA